MGLTHSKLNTEKPEKVENQFETKEADNKAMQVHRLTRYLNSKDKQHQNEASVRKYENNLNNLALLRQIVKRMDPTVMKTFTRTYLGEIKLSIKYRREDKMLLLRVIEAKNLLTRDLRGKSTDSYIKAYIHPSDMNASKLTKTVKKSADPYFDEILDFYLEDTQLKHDPKLIIQVWDRDILSEDDFIGETIIELESLIRDANNSSILEERWFHLNPETNLSVKGELRISLDYQQAQNQLLVRVLDAGDLGEDTSPDDLVFVKFQLLGSPKVYETAKRKYQNNTEWNEEFSLEIDTHTINQSRLIFHIITLEGESENQSLGQAIWDLQNLPTNKEVINILTLADLRNKPRVRSEQNQSTTAQEFKEMLLAHASIRAPAMVFQNHETSSKIIKLSCRKAGSSAQVCLINGVPIS